MCNIRRPWPSDRAQYWLKVQHHSIIGISNSQGCSCDMQVCTARTVTNHQAKGAAVVPTQQRWYLSLCCWARPQQHASPHSQCLFQSAGRSSPAPSAHASAALAATIAAPAVSFETRLSTPRHAAEALRSTELKTHLSESPEFKDLPHSTVTTADPCPQTSISDIPPDGGGAAVAQAGSHATPNPCMTPTSAAPSCSHHQALSCQRHAQNFQNQGPCTWTPARPSSLQRSTS